MCAIMKHDLSTYLQNLLGFFFEIQALLIVNFRGTLKNVRFHQPYFFQDLDHLQFRRENQEARLSE